MYPPNAPFTNRRCPFILSVQRRSVLRVYLLWGPCDLENVDQHLRQCLGHLISTTNTGKGEINHHSKIVDIRYRSRIDFRTTWDFRYGINEDSVNMLLYMMQGSSYQAEIIRPKPFVPPVTMNDLPDKPRINDGVMPQIHCKFLSAWCPLYALMYARSDTTTRAKKGLPRQ